MKRTKKLVPLMPILVRLGACRDGREWVAKANHATFREAYKAASKENSGFTAWLGARLNAERVTGVCLCPYCCPRVPDLAARVERALYDFAVREGLA